MFNMWVLCGLAGWLAGWLLAGSWLAHGWLKVLVGRKGPGGQIVINLEMTIWGVEMTINDYLGGGNDYLLLAVHH